ncbi:hypothetical protein FSPOR_9116 [Fusarium sporotrichioides]|uniref:Uncharacterized protein n=1 Tax=Fusarium sporotrichioides TaxID=5514 RepID=A0A395RQX8_FUSSP|nr:hypothetical protein FSPOR_9116 [Fusarium sporotrichioides]
MASPSTYQKAPTKATMDFTLLDPRSASIFDELYPEQIKAAKSIKKQTGQYPWELIPEANDEGWLNGDTLTSLDRLIRLWELMGDNVRLDKLLGIFSPSIERHDRAWGRLLLRPEIVAVQDGLFPAPHLWPLTQSSSSPPTDWTLSRTRLQDSPPWEQKQTTTTPTEVGSVSPPASSADGSIEPDEIFDDAPIGTTPTQECKKDVLDAPAESPLVSSPASSVDDIIEEKALLEDASIGTTPTQGCEKDILDAPTDLSIERVSFDLVPADHKTVDDQNTKHPDASLSVLSLLNKDNSSPVDWARKCLGTRVKDATRHIEMLLNTVKSNADIILKKLEVERDDGASNMILSKEIRDITTRAYESRWADAAAAKEDIPHIQKLIEASEACQQSKDFDQSFGIARHVIARQLKVLKPLLQRARDATSLATKSKVAQVEAREELEQIVTQLKKIDGKIEEWEAVRFAAETELSRILLVVAFAQISVQDMRALEVKHPGFLKDVNEVVEKFGEHSE